MRTAVLVIVAAVGAQGCAELGYSDRVLHRIPSPADAALIAVCQEVPAFDGPGFDVRLERPDGSLVRGLYRSGDGDPCHEMAWSADGRSLAIVSSHVARAIVVDVAGALSRPEPRTDAWARRSISLAGQDGKQLARRLRFVAPGELEYEVCTHEFGKGVDWRVCTAPAETRRLRLPGRPAARRQPSTAFDRRLPSRLGLAWLGVD